MRKAMLTYTVVSEVIEYKQCSLAGEGSRVLVGLNIMLLT